MSLADTQACRIFEGSNDPTAPVIYVIDSPVHPLELAPLAQGRMSTIVTIPVSNWNDALTPWQAPGLYRGEPAFGGQAATTLAELADTTIPNIEQAAELSPTARAICGYSLGGLFALYALTHNNLFAACACLSGSVWYEGWVDHLRELDVNLTGRYAFLSVGTKERKAARPILKTVQSCMEACADILAAKGARVDYRTGPGNHMQFIPERFDAGLSALDAFLASHMQQ